MKYFTALFLALIASTAYAGDLYWLQLTPNEWALMEDGRQVGGWNRDYAVYRERLSRDEWGPPQPWPPIDPPGQTPVNYGVDYSRVGQKTSTGDPDELVDDSDNLRLTVIGTESQRKAVVDALKDRPELEGVTVQDYDPSHWHVKDAGFKVDGSPTIYLQRPDGVVLHRQDDFEGGVDSVLTALRRADPTYDPTKDADLRNVLNIPELPPWAWAIGGGLLVFLLFGKQKQQ